MNDTPLEALFEAIAGGLSRPVHLWTAIIILTATAMAYGLAQLVKRRTTRRLHTLNQRFPEGARANAVRFSVEGLRRLAFPLFAEGLLWLGEAGLRVSKLAVAPVDVRLLRIATLLFAAMAVIRLAVYVVQRVFSNVALITNSERVIAGGIWLVVALHITGLLDDTVDWLEGAKLPLGATSVSLWALLTGGVLIVVTLVATLWIGAMIEDRLMRVRTLDGNLRAVLSRVVRALLVVLGLLVVLSLVGIDITVLSVFGGALGVGLGLGLQRIASNYVAGFIILLERSLRLGDLITVDKYNGRVTQITTRYTVVSALDGTQAIVPNEMLIATPVTNHSYSNNLIRLAVRVTVGYGTELAPVFTLLEACARQTAKVLAEPAPRALFIAFGPNGPELEVAFFINDPLQDRLAVQSEVARAVYQQLQAQRIQVPLPQREVHIGAAGAAALGSAGDVKPA